MIVRSDRNVPVVVNLCEAKFLFFTKALFIQLIRARLSINKEFFYILLGETIGFTAVFNQFVFLRVFKCFLSTIATRKRRSRHEIDGWSRKTFYFNPFQNFQLLASKNSPYNNMLVIREPLLQRGYVLFGRFESFLNRRFNGYRMREKLSVCFVCYRNRV